MNTFITIPGFEQMTKQQLFDISVAHIAKTRRPSLKHVSDGSGSPVCTYTGSGCAAAPFIRKEERARADSGGDTTVTATNWLQLVRSGLVPRHQQFLVIELQRCHDSASQTRKFMSTWKEFMYELAARYDDINTNLLDVVPV